MQRFLLTITSASSSITTYLFFFFEFIVPIASSHVLLFQLSLAHLCTLPIQVLTMNMVYNYRDSVIVECNVEYEVTGGGRSFTTRCNEQGVWADVLHCQSKCPCRKYVVVK